MPERKVYSLPMTSEELVTLPTRMSLGQVVVHQTNQHGSVANSFPRCCAEHEYFYEQAQHAVHELGPERWEAFMAKYEALMKAALPDALIIDADTGRPL